MPSSKSDGLRIVASGVAAGALALLAFASVHGCSLKNCDGGQAIFLVNDATPVPADSWFVNSPKPATERVVDEWTWESGAFNEAFLDFPAQRTYWFFPQGNDAFPGPYTNIVAYLSADPNPANTPGSNFTIGSGNIAEIFMFPDGSAFGIHNDTCAHYYVRVVATRGTPDAGPDSGPPATDADVDGDDGGVDVAADAPADAPLDGADAGAD